MLDTAGEVSGVLQWTSIHGHNSVGRPGKFSIYRLLANTECNLEDLPRAMPIGIDSERTTKESMLENLLNCEQYDGHK